jgi:hypothetical protein
MITAEEGTEMDRRNIDLAAQLLAKAQRTDFDAEAIAFVEKSYSLLAKVITAFDDEVDPNPSGPRKRERRLLRDRRAARRHGLFGGGGSGRGVDAARSYRQLTEDRRPQGDGHINFEA